MTKTNAMTDLQQPAPELPDSAVGTLLKEKYGLHGTWRALLSERDQNFRVTTTSGDRYVLKIANAAEDASTTERQVAVLNHLEISGCPVSTPRVVRSNDGASLETVEFDEVQYRCRLVTFLDGAVQSSRPDTEAFAVSLGEATAHLLGALADFHSDVADQPLLWDLQHASQLRPLLDHILDDALRNACRDVLDDFDEFAQPILATLPRQAIHGDLNSDNVLAGECDQVAGVIDFGDMVRAPRVCELAITAAYQRGSRQDPLQFVCAYLRGFARHQSLTPTEAELIFDLVRARLTASISILHWRQAERGADDEYARRSLDSESTAAGFLRALDALGRERANTEIARSLSI